MERSECSLDARPVEQRRRPGNTALRAESTSKYADDRQVPGHRVDSINWRRRFLGKLIKSWTNKKFVASTAVGGRDGAASIRTTTGVVAGLQRDISATISEKMYTVILCVVARL